MCDFVLTAVHRTNNSPKLLTDAQTTDNTSVLLLHWLHSAQVQELLCVLPAQADPTH